MCVCGCVGVCVCVCVCRCVCVCHHQAQCAVPADQVMVSCHDLLLVIVPYGTIWYNMVALCGTT